MMTNRGDSPRGRFQPLVQWHVERLAVVRGSAFLLRVRPRLWTYPISGEGYVVPACVRVTTQTLCDSYKQCRWNRDTNVCTDNLCYSLTNDATCFRNFKCEWIVNESPIHCDERPCMVWATAATCGGDANCQWSPNNYCISKQCHMKFSSTSSAIRIISSP